MCPQLSAARREEDALDVSRPEWLDEKNVALLTVARSEGLLITKAGPGGGGGGGAEAQEARAPDTGQQIARIRR